MRWAGVTDTVADGTYRGRFAARADREDRVGVGRGQLGNWAIGQLAGGLRRTRGNGVFCGLAGHHSHINDIVVKKFSLNTRLLCMACSGFVADITSLWSNVIFGGGTIRVMNIIWMRIVNSERMFDLFIH
jgi:hypothetical protein